MNEIKQPASPVKAIPVKTEQMKMEAVATEGMAGGQKVMLGVIVAVVLIGGYFWMRSGTASDTALPAPEIGSSPAVIAPIVDGDMTYTLGKVTWMFEPQGVDSTGAAMTRVRLQLTDLKRNEVPIDVAPYRLGTYRGDCQSYEATDSKKSLPDPDAIAFAECWSGDTGRQLAVFEEGNSIVVKVRPVTEEDTQLADLTQILTIDVPAIVQH